MKTRHKIALAGGGLLMLGLIVLIMFGQNGYIDYLHLKAQKNKLVADNNAARQGNLLLRRQISRLQHDDNYIRYIARKELGMIEGDEIVYKFKEPGERP